MPAGFHLGDFAWAAGTVFATVLLIILIRKYGTLPVSMISLGPDLNLLTYGFLWDTALTAIGGHPYWPRYNLTLIGSGYLLLTIAGVNLILMAWNFKLAHYAESCTGSKKFGMTIVVLAVGTVSCLVFLYAKSFWG